MIKSCFLAVFLATLTVSPVFAREKATAAVPLQSASNDSGPKATVNLLWDDSTTAPAPNYVAAVHDPMGPQDPTSEVIKEEISAVNPHPVKNNLPPTITVKTTTLQELHAMRQSAVDLCIQLPTKYRTHLPQCAEIFKHEIRLETFAKENH